jgi:hypothetical protein
MLINVLPTARSLELPGEAQAHWALQLVHRHCADARVKREARFQAGWVGVPARSAAVLVLDSGNAEQVPRAVRIAATCSASP